MIGEFAEDKVTPGDPSQYVSIDQNDINNPKNAAMVAAGERFSGDFKNSFPTQCTIDKQVCIASIDEWVALQRTNIFR